MRKKSIDYEASCQLLTQAAKSMCRRAEELEDQNQALIQSAASMRARLAAMRDLASNLALKNRNFSIEVKQLRERVRQLLDHCPDPECHTCGEIICPHGEALHFHHDGCPACEQFKQNGELS
jgi:hypothetical protein